MKLGIASITLYLPNTLVGNCIHIQKLITCLHYTALKYSVVLILEMHVIHVANITYMNQHYLSVRVGLGGIQLLNF